MGRLIIDGLTVIEDSAPGRNSSLHVQDPLYIGGVPSERALKNIQVNKIITPCETNNSNKITIMRTVNH